MKQRLYTYAYYTPYILVCVLPSSIKLEERRGETRPAVSGCGGFWSSIASSSSRSASSSKSHSSAPVASSLAGAAASVARMARGKGADAAPSGCPASSARTCSCSVDAVCCSSIIWSCCCTICRSVEHVRFCEHMMENTNARAVRDDEHLYLL